MTVVGLEWIGWRDGRDGGGGRVSGVYDTGWSAYMDAGNIHMVVMGNGEQGGGEVHEWWCWCHVMWYIWMCVGTTSLRLTGNDG